MGIAYKVPQFTLSSLILDDDEAHARSNCHSSIVSNIPPTEVLHTIVNQEHELNDEGWHGTALHYAVEKGALEAARRLLENGATIDKLDSEGVIPLGLRSNQDMMKLLVHHGASLYDHFSRNILNCIRWDIEVFTDIVSAYPGNPERGLPNTTPAFLPTAFDARGSIECQQMAISPVHLVSILGTKFDLNRELGSEISIMHLAVVNDPSSSFVLNSDLSFEETTPFPWHLQFWSSLSFLSSMFKHFRRKLKDEGLVRIAHLQPARGRSPLCRAVYGNEELLRNCLSLGADIDFEGSPHGSALVLACAIGSLEAVRILVRAGASLSYKGQNGHKSVFTFCRSKSVRRWLLIERFKEQRRIEMRPNWEESESIRPWAGIAIARLKLVGDRSMCYHETLVDYAERLARMRKDWRGKVIPSICIEGIVYRS